MKVLLYLLLLHLFSCATKPYSKQKGWPEGVRAVREEIYEVTDKEVKLLQASEINFTSAGRIKSSKTRDAQGKLLSETQKKLWFVVQMFPGKESYYCKTRWKPKQRERISCYTKKQFKQTESIYRYNKDGTIAEMVDHFDPFHQHSYLYAEGELARIEIRDNNAELLDEVLISCMKKDENGLCTEEMREWTHSPKKQIIRLFPIYKKGLNSTENKTE